MSWIQFFLCFSFSISINAATLTELNNEKLPLKLPALTYSFDSLLPIIDKETMEIHHGKHHKAYIDNANKALPKENRNVLAILKKVSKEPDSVRNNVGGHWNHSFFWTLLTPDKTKNQMSENFKNEINKHFGDFEKFKLEFESAGSARFGSGWVWLIRNKKNKLEIVSTANQDNPIMDVVKINGWPILGVDVWEHSYYLKYQNKRAEYLKNIWNIINWAQVESYDEEAKKQKF